MDCEEDSEKLERCIKYYADALQTEGFSEVGIDEFKKEFYADLAIARNTAPVRDFNFLKNATTFQEGPYGYEAIVTDASGECAVHVNSISCYKNINLTMQLLERIKGHFWVVSDAYGRDCVHSIALGQTICEYLARQRKVIDMNYK